MKTVLTIVGMIAVFTLQAQVEQLTVMDAIKKALSNNYDIRLIAGNYETTKLQNSWGQAGLYPTFSLDVNNSVSLQDNTNNPATFFPGVLFNDNLQASLNMSWTVFSGFGIRINKARFEQLQAQTKGNAIVVIENTIYEVVLAYYSAVVQDRKSNVLESLLAFSKDKENYYKLKSSMGINTSFDLLEFKNQVLTDSSNLILQDLAQLNAQRNLNLLMAEDVEKRYILTDSLEFTAAATEFEGLKQKMLSNNQNLKNQFINYELQDLNLEAKKSAFYPVISLNLATTPSVGYFRLLGDDGFSASTNAWSNTGSINLRYDLFQGWNRKRNTQIAEIELEMAEVQIDQLENSLTHRLRGFFDMYQTRVKIEDMALKRLSNAKKLWNLGQEKYDLGLINIFNLNDIKLNYEAAMLDYYDRLYELLQSYYDLMRITGSIAQEFKIAENFDPEND